MKQEEQKVGNAKKRRIIIALIIVISVSILVIVSAVIYNRFFEDNINMEAKKKAIAEIWDKNLKETSEQVKIDIEAQNKLIKEHSLDIFGKYVCVFNEPVETDSMDEQAGILKTESVTTVMMINEDNTIDFADGKIGWWALSESEEGVIHMGYGIEGAQSMGMFIVCDNCLVDISGGVVLFGELPAEDTFDGEFTDGNGTFKFNKDGTLDAEYIEMVTENGVEFPYTEIYSGKYRKNGKYMDIMLNADTARYITFSAKTNDPEKNVSGIAARYFEKVNE